MSSWEIGCRLNSKRIEKQTYEWRRSQVSTVKGKVPDASDNHVTSINAKIDECVNDLAAGIKGINCLGTLTSDMTGKKEASGTSDTKLASYDSTLANELSDCNTKISQLESDISSLESQYQQALADEEAARRRAWEEAQKKIMELLEI